MTIVIAAVNPDLMGSKLLVSLKQTCLLGSIRLGSTMLRGDDHLLSVWEGRLGCLPTRAWQPEHHEICKYY